MPSKPDFLGPQVASAFQDPSVVLAYQYHPTYPAEVFALLAGLVVDNPRCVLDAGCGTGLLVRSLVERVDHVDAADSSHLMIEQGKQLPQGNHPRLTWIVGRMEEVPLHPPYALITTGDSLHWMDWEVVMPRFAQVLAPHGSLAILGVEQLPTPFYRLMRSGSALISENLTTTMEYGPWGGKRTYQNLDKVFILPL